MNKSTIKTERLILRPWRENDFDLPKLADEHPLKRQVLYRLKRNEWVENQLNQK